jgi:hypothetical protein
MPSETVQRWAAAAGYDSVEEYVDELLDVLEAFVHADDEISHSHAIHRAETLIRGAADA